MRVQFPDLVTLSLKRNLKLGARMEVHTLQCAVYHHMIRKEEQSLTLTRMGMGRGLENQPQWERFRRIIEGRCIIVYSFRELEEFWPVDQIREFHGESGKNLIELSQVVRLFFPGMTFRTAADVLEFLSGAVQSDEGVSEDPTFELFIELSAYVSSLELKSYQDVVMLLSVSMTAVAEWLDRLRHVTLPRKNVPPFLPDNIRRGDSDDPEVTYGMTDDSIEAIFSKDGPAGLTMPEFEKRPEQVKYAKSYLKSLRDDQYFLAEAGTGTGKSLAYLVPALLHSMNRGSAIVVSTHTRNLQHQLFYKDLAQAEQMVGRRFSSLVLKGRGNYLCLLRMHIARAMAARKFSSEQLGDLASVLIWKDLTISGDLSELGGLSQEVKRDISCDAAFCPGAQCAHYRGCFFLRARRAALKSDVVVTNHALFFSDLLSEADILGEPEVVIFDEAHQVERVATDSITGELSRATLAGILDPLESIDPAVPPRLSNVAGILVHQTEIESVRKTIRDTCADCDHLVTECSGSINSLFAAFAWYVEKHKMVPSGYSRRERFGPSHGFLEVVEPRLTRLHSDLRSLGEKLTRLIDQVDGSELRPEDVIDFESIQSVVRSTRSYMSHIENILRVEDEKWVRWIEVSPSGWCSIRIAPVEIGEMMNELVFKKHKRVLFTSATISVEGDFSFLEERLGLDRISAGSRMKRIFGSSFDFKSQVRFLCAAYLPSPRSDHYQKRLSAFLRSLFARVDRSTLVLFTSYQSIRQTVLDLAGRFPKLLAQEGSDSAEKILHDYKQLRPAILLGTDSFWHGVDLPGELLELLVITRLPFSVPGDPIDAARMELVEKRGANSFASYSLPAAVLRFKQGFGRLIRTATDQGVIIVTDNRLVRSRFGQAFLNSVPSELEIATCWEEVERALVFD